MCKYFTCVLFRFYPVHRPRCLRNVKVYNIPTTKYVKRTCYIKKNTHTHHGPKSRPHLLRKKSEKSSIEKLVSVDRPSKRKRPLFDFTSAFSPMFLFCFCCCCCTVLFFGNDSRPFKVWNQTVEYR